jgi:hypothetical protein
MWIVTLARVDWWDDINWMDRRFGTTAGCRRPFRTPIGGSFGTLLQGRDRSAAIVYLGELMKSNLPDVPAIIPPRSVVRLVRFDRTTPRWKTDVGRRFRVGYYRPKDGLDCIWLVNNMGEYEQTTDRGTLLRFFDIERTSKESDYFGEKRRPLRALTATRGAAKLSRVAK